MSSNSNQSARPPPAFALRCYCSCGCTSRHGAALQSAKVSQNKATMQLSLWGLCRLVPNVYLKNIHAKLAYRKSYIGTNMSYYSSKCRHVARGLKQPSTIKAQHYSTITAHLTSIACCCQQPPVALSCRPANRTPPLLDRSFQEP